MATTTHLDTADRIAMYGGGGLVFVGIVVLGTVNVLAGAETPLYVYELVQGGETTTGTVIAPALAPEGATIVASPLVGPTIRAYVVALGLVIFGLYGVYRPFAGRAEEPRAGRERPAAAGDDT